MNIIYKYLWLWKLQYSTKEYKFWRRTRPVGSLAFLKKPSPKTRFTTHPKHIVRGDLNIEPLWAPETIAHCHRATRTHLADSRTINTGACREWRQRVCTSERNWYRHRCRRTPVTPFVGNDCKKYWYFFRALHLSWFVFKNGELQFIRLEKWIDCLFYV